MGRLETILEARALVERVGVVEDGCHYAEELVDGKRRPIGPIFLRARQHGELCGVCIAGACIVADPVRGYEVWSETARLAACEVLERMGEDLGDWQDSELSGAIDKFGEPYVLAVLDEMAARERHGIKRREMVS